eukprot:Partr_v1_DN28479_c0_g1_i1_m41418 putative ribophorin II
MAFNLGQQNSASTDVFEPLPEIHHTFRADSKMPSATISYAFTLIVLAPVLFLAYSWLKLNANLSRFPSNDPARLLQSLAFVGSLAAFVYVLFMYWWSLNIFNALYLLTPICGLLVFTTRNAVLAMASSE